jgi:type VI secretion system secreted protein VgrG
VWAGKQWGAIHIPRIGQEVIVDFLEGDPDQPIITGRVYNGANMPPYTLPANQTQSGIKSRSSKGGGPDNFNEIRFEDKKGQEEVYIHAERNLKTVVEASESRSVGGSRTTTIQKDETLTIKEGNRTETLEKGNDTLTLKQGNRTTTLDKGNDTLKATLGNITIEAPAGKYSVSAKDVEITGTTSVKIVCGGSSIEMTPASITMKSPTIEINGATLTTVKGGLVKINC